jgi:hypothetical protein
MLRWVPLGKTSGQGRSYLSGRVCAPSVSTSLDVTWAGGKASGLPSCLVAHELREGA